MQLGWSLGLRNPGNSWDDEYPPLLRPDGFLHLEGVTYWCPELIHPIIDFRTRRFFNLGCTPKRKSPGAFRITCKSPQKSTQNHILFFNLNPKPPSVLGGKFHWPLRFFLLGRLVACHTAQAASNDIGLEQSCMGSRIREGRFWKRHFLSSTLW